MKRTCILVILLVALSGMASANSDIDVTVENISPQPSDPGDTVNVHVIVKNEGTGSSSFKPIQVETVDGISVIGTTDSFGSRFSLCGGCQMIGTIRLKIGEDSVSGMYPVDIGLVGINGVGVVETAELEVDGTPNLVISSSRTEAVPGQNVSTNITIRNVGTDVATQIVLDTSESSFSIHPSPIVVGRLAPDQSVTRTVTLRPDDSISNGIKHLGVKATYRDENKERSKDTSITIDVMEKAEVVVSDVTTNNPVIGSRSSITVTLENLGPGEAERIVAEISCPDTADVLSGRSFVGQLDDEENVPVTFTISPRAGTVRCTIKVQYSDATRQSFSESFSFAATKKGIPTVLIGLAVLAVASAGIYWRRSRKKDELAEI